MNRYNSLYPPFLELLLIFEEKFKKETGIPVFLFCGFRSHEEQHKLYEIGRRGIENELKITNARPGSSFHQYGIAADYVFDSNLEKPGIQWSWDDKFPWNDIGKISKELGFEWGGDFKYIKDKPHIQKRWGLSIEKAKWYYEGSGIKAVWNYLDLSRNVNGNAVKDKKNVKSFKTESKSESNDKPINDLEDVQDNQEGKEVKKENIIKVIVNIIITIIKSIKRFYASKRKMG